MINYVDSFKDAEDSPVMFGTSDIFMNRRKNVFYCKVVDHMGNYTMGTYRFEQIENEKPLTSDDFVPREQFDALAAKIDNLMALLTQPTPQPEPVTTTTPQSSRKQKSEVTTDGK